MATNERARIVRVGAWCGLASLLCYGSFFFPLPTDVLQYPALAFGPLLVVGILGLSEELRSVPDCGWMVETGKVFGIVGGALASALLTIQLGNNLWHEERMAGAETPAQEEAARTIHTAVNRVQAFLDVSWDVFITIAAIALAAAMIRHPGYGRVVGWTGIGAGALLLSLNLVTFPDGPAYAGLFDAGPVLGLWFGVVFVMVLRRAGPTGEP